MARLEKRDPTDPPVDVTITMRKLCHLKLRLLCLFYDNTQKQVLNKLIAEDVKLHGVSVGKWELPGSA